MSKNRNTFTMPDSRYKKQQETLNAVASKLGLVVFRPNYHAQDNDCNTVMLYAKEDDTFNRQLEREGGWNFHPPIWTFENTDVNGRFSLDFANRGRLDFRGLNREEDVLMASITAAMEEKGIVIPILENATERKKTAENAEKPLPSKEQLVSAFETIAAFCKGYFQDAEDPFEGCFDCPMGTGCAGYCGNGVRLHTMANTFIAEIKAHKPLGS